VEVQQQKEVGDNPENVEIVKDEDVTDQNLGNEAEGGEF
jgi:hypothetical protein